MQILTENIWKPIEDQISRLLWETYYQPIFDMMAEPIYNSTQVVINALRDGRISFYNGEFTGKFNASISRELSKYCKYDKRTGTYRGNPPPDIKAAAVIARQKMQDFHNNLKSKLRDLGKQLDKDVKGIDYKLQPAVVGIEKDVKTSLDKIGIQPNMNPRIIDRLEKEYKKNQDLNIKNWHPEQIERLREIIEKSVLNGYRKKEMIDFIMREYEVSKNKAKFWARQETSLFMSKVQETRYTDAGLKFYYWSTSHDERVRGNPAGLYPIRRPDSDKHPDHFILNGMLCKWNDPTVYSDNHGKTWKSRAAIGAPLKHPGQDYNCRCIAKPAII